MLPSQRNQLAESLLAVKGLAAMLPGAVMKGGWHSWRQSWHSFLPCCSLAGLWQVPVRQLLMSVRHSLPVVRPLKGQRRWRQRFRPWMTAISRSSF